MKPRPAPATHSPWRRQRIRQARADFDGVTIPNRTTQDPVCVVCGATPEDENLANLFEYRLEVGMIGLCSVCEQGPLCDICAEQHESTTKHPAMALDPDRRETQ